MANQPPSQTDMNKALFLNLVSMLSMSAMQELGKLKNPFTGKTEVHLDMAQSTIDMLDMLEAKTRGNRDTDEEKMIKDTLTMLKMNFVETSSAGTSEPKPSRSEQDGINDQQTTPLSSNSGNQQDDKKTTAGHVEAGKDKPEPKDPKFHKSYS